MFRKVCLYHFRFFWFIKIDRKMDQWIKCLPPMRKDRCSDHQNSCKKASHSNTCIYNPSTHVCNPSATMGSWETKATQCLEAWRPTSIREQETQVQTTWKTGLMLHSELSFVLSAYMCTRARARAHTHTCFVLQDLLYPSVRLGKKVLFSSWKTFSVFVGSVAVKHSLNPVPCSF